MLIRERQRSRRRAAFTLMEMLVVVAIIVALAGIGGFFLLGQLGEAKKDVASTQIRGPLTQAVQAYNLKHGQFPDTLEMLLDPSVRGGPYLESKDAIIDPWGKQYIYEKSGTKNKGLKPDIYSIPPGADGERDWIGNWSKIEQGSNR